MTKFSCRTPVNAQFSVQGAFRHGKAHKLVTDMNRKSILLITLVMAAGTLVAADEDLTTIEAKIVGVWKHEHRQLGVQADTFKTYGADGSYRATSAVRMLGTNSGVDYEGKWEILPGPVLRLTVTKTNNRLYVPMGAVYRMEGLKIEEGVMSYMHKGAAEREVRQER